MPAGASVEHCGRWARPFGFMNPLSLLLLWLKWRPIKRWRELKTARRAATTGAATAAGSDGMGEIAQSMLRSAMKVLGTALITYAVTHSFIDAAQTDTAVIALDAVGGGVLTLAGLWLSYRKHKT